MEKKAKGSFLKGKSLRLLGFSVPIMGFLAAAIVLVILAVGVLHTAMNRGTKREVITVSTLEKIVHVSELSTFTAVYNGIAEVADEEKSDKIEYYVSYDAKVNAGIDFEKIAFEIDNEAKIIHVNHLWTTSLSMTRKTVLPYLRRRTKPVRRMRRAKVKRKRRFLSLQSRMQRILSEPLSSRLWNSWTLRIHWILIGRAD